MKIGLSYDLKDSITLGPNQPEDALEEYDILETIDGIAAALEGLGHTVARLGGGKEFLRKILKARVDIVFNIAEGLGTYRSREAQVPSVLEMLDIPYCASDPQCLAVCHDKHLAKKMVALEGVTTPKWRMVSNLNQLKGIDWQGFPLPVFIKPAYEGSSKGVRLTSRLEKAEEIEGTVANLLECYHQPAIVEEFIDGDEVTVGMIGNSPARVLGIMRVLPRKQMPYFIYSLEIKRDWENLVDYECPARLEDDVMKRIEAFALKAFEVLGCRDVARMDFRIRDGEPYFLELNPLPGLNPHYSDLPIMARMMGWSYNSLIAAILDAALRRYPNV